ncbi:hypothetical protein J6Z37_02055 [Candidatus Saccharibacteria bacterium]|nr:hypothetical protein [Candidatus Saccharibacteria bacterium]
MKGDFQLISFKDAHDYIFASTGEIREAYPAIVARERQRDGTMELGLALIGATDDCIIYYMDSNRIIQLYRAMNILGELNAVSEISLSNCFLIASRRYNSRVKSIIDHQEHMGVDIIDIQSGVFAHEIEQREIDRIMKTIDDLHIEIQRDELEEELKIRYIPETKFIRKTIAAVG